MTDDVLADGASVFTPGVSVRNSGATKFLHGDRLGTFSRETDGTQATTATKQYDAFGMPLSSTGTSVSPFGFVGGFGYQEDPDSALKLLGHRYYDPSAVRILAKADTEWRVNLDYSRAGQIGSSVQNAAGSARPDPTPGSPGSCRAHRFHLRGGATPGRGRSGQFPTAARE